MFACAAATLMFGLAGASTAFAVPPANDNFANAAPIQRIDDRDGTNRIVDDTFEATTETGEPLHRDGSNAPTGNNDSVWYSWTPDHTADAFIFVCSFVPGQFAPLLFGAYTGSAVGSLTPTGTNQPLDCSTGGPGGSDIVHTLNAQAGTTYHFAVAGTEDTFILGVFQPPRNDAFANAELLSGTSGQVTGDNVQASSETGEPSHGDGSLGVSVWYRWTAPMGGKATLNTCGSEGNTLLAVYTGASVNSLTPLASNNDSASCPPQSRLSFMATKGTTYRIAIDSSNDPPGAITLNYLLEQIPQTTITSGPSGVTKDATPTFRFSSSVTGSTFQCRFDNQFFRPCSGPGAVHTPASPLADGAHTFVVRAVNGSAIDPTPATRTFTVDTHPPQTTITAGPSGVTHDNTPTFKFVSSEPGSTFQCRIRVAGGTGSFGACSGAGSHTPSLPLANGNYVFSVRARDRAGNIDPTPANRSFTVVP